MDNGLNKELSNFLDSLEPTNCNDIQESFMRLHTHEIEKVNECLKMLDNLSNTNLTISTDYGSCHVHTCRTDADAMIAIEYARRAITAISDRHTKSAKFYMDLIIELEKKAKQE